MIGEKFIKLMKSFAFLLIASIAITSSSFLRELAADITITGLKSPICQALPNKNVEFVFSSTCSSQQAATDDEFGLELYTTASTPALASKTTCSQAATSNADITCKLATDLSAGTAGVYTFKVAADTTTTQSDTVKAWTGASIGFSTKAYVAPGTQTAQDLKYEDDKFNFTVVFAANLGADLPTVKVNTTAVDCSVIDADKKKLTCLMKKETFKEENKDKPYIATITSVCGVEETATVTIKASASFYSFSKIALAVIALFLF